MSYVTVKLKERPDIARIIRAALPKYRKHTATLYEHHTEVTPTGTYWDGGSVTTYYHVTQRGSVRHVPAPSAPPQFGGGEIKTFAIPHSDAVVSAGTFRGKPSFATVYLNN